MSHLPDVPSELIIEKSDGQVTLKLFRHPLGDLFWRVVVWAKAKNIGAIHLNGSYNAVPILYTSNSVIRELQHAAVETANKRWTDDGAGVEPIAAAGTIVKLYHAINAELLSRP